MEKMSQTRPENSDCSLNMIDSNVDEKTFQAYSLPVN